MVCAAQMSQNGCWPRGWTNVFSVRGGIAEYARLVDGKIGKY
jgi:hypothetical protein